MNANDQFNENTKNANPEDIQKIKANLSGMKRGPIADIWDKVQLLWKMICDPDAAWWAKAIAIGALIYLISPIDAIPDFIPVVGLTDDVGVILLAVSQVLSELGKYKG
ncbi:MAG: DUF1232 domain-containing protein [Bacteroidetes bacterium]|nr:DUF1232 domain-containing protein [Bacteroidota bacterium]